MQTKQKIQQNLYKKMIETRKQRLRSSFKPFTGVSNRLEEVGVKNGVTFINDSKAENVNATYFALKSIKKPIIWIAGGEDAQTDYWELMSLVRQKVEAIIMIGRNNERLHHFFSPVISQMYEVDDMCKVVRLAYSLSEQGTTVLLSPACKPDMNFANYSERGLAFVNAVKNNI